MTTTIIAHQDIVEKRPARRCNISPSITAPITSRNLGQSYRAEASPAAKAAIGQILESSRLAAIGRRPICQDTGMVHGLRHT